MSLSALRQWWRARRGTGVQFTPSDYELRMLTEHLQYEVQMTFDLAHLLVDMFSTPPSSSMDQISRNALLEAFTIHVRQLVEFFWSERSPRRKVTLADAYAADYFEPGKWRSIRPARPNRLDRVLTGKVGWGVAHLTYGRARSTLTDKQWEPVRMCAALAPTARIFIDKVDPAKLDPKWFAEIKPCLDRFDAKYGSVTP